MVSFHYLWAQHLVSQKENYWRNTCKRRIKNLVRQVYTSMYLLVRACPHERKLREKDRQRKNITWILHMTQKQSNIGEDISHSILLQGKCIIDSNFRNIRTARTKIYTWTLLSSISISLAFSHNALTYINQRNNALKSILQH